MVAVDCYIWPLLKYIPCIPNLITFFIIKDHSVLSNAFSASIEMVTWFFKILIIILRYISIDSEISHSPLQIPSTLFDLSLIPLLKHCSWHCGHVQWQRAQLPTVRIFSAVSVGNRSLVWMQRDILYSVSTSGHGSLRYTPITHPLKYRARKLSPQQGEKLNTFINMKLNNMLQSYQCMAKVMKKKINVSSWVYFHSCVEMPSVYFLGSW